jgi:hypothetical protein
MTLVLDKIDPTAPQTHALIIGVGHYEYLKGGEFYTSDRANIPTTVAAPKSAT